MGRLEIIYGPMFSGKTTTLLQKLTEFHDLGLRVLYLNHSTHSSSIKQTEFSFDMSSISTLSNTTLYDSYDVIGIDEAQFFDSSLITFCDHFVFDKNKIVIVAGLSGTFERKKFGFVLDLIPMSEKQISLHAYCKPCFEKHRQAVPAYFSFRITQSRNVIEVGDTDMYIPVCSRCHSSLSH